VAYPHDMNSYSQNPHALAPPWNISRKRWKVQVEDHSILGKFVIGHLTRNAGKTCYGCPVIPPLWRVTFVKGSEGFSLEISEEQQTFQISSASESF
jgi:hypothetical protein